jgi:hypothetical protein
MKRTHAWHDTPLGIGACWLGSIQFAVPILIFVAIALAVGTYLESTESARVAKSVVYGSPWFMVLMGLVCVSLIFAVITRYPWKRKHVGFIIVHASLVSLIAGGFWSLMGRMEGHMGLSTGETSGILDMDQERLEIFEHDKGEMRSLGDTEVPGKPGKFTIAGIPFELIESWENAHEQFDVMDDGADPYRAVQIQFGPMAESAVWIGDEAKGEAPVMDGIKIRVLADGLDWTPPAPPKAPEAVNSPAASTPAPTVPETASKKDSTYTFVIDGKPFVLGAEGAEAFPGWTIQSVKRFAHATVASGGITEDPNQKDNPAVEVTITDGKGSTEKHTAFVKAPDMVLVRMIAGTAKSGARLVPPPDSDAPTTPMVAAKGGEETVVFFGKLPGMKVGYIGKDGTTKVIEHDNTFPWTADFGTRKLTIARQFARAREQATFVRAPSSESGARPALVLRGPDGQQQVLAWKAMIPVGIPGRMAIMRFHPRQVNLPFAIRLDKFRKTDYPGTEMAMAYESDVTVQPLGGGERRATISMNAPLVESEWKVYQSGFMGTDVSVFSVMKDPGLPLTYIASVGLCVGILITFYGRGLTWGHPGVPAPFSGKELSNASVAAGSDPGVAGSVNGVREHEHAGVG